jgi:parallel beta-helix repeat protein
MNTARIAVLGVALIAALMVFPSSGLAHGGSPALSPASLRPTSIAPGVFSGGVTIYSNGTSSPAGAPISQSGNTYTLSAAFTGYIVDERNGSTINGGGVTLTANPGDAGVTVDGATDVTVEDVTVAGATDDAFELDYAGTVALTSDTAMGTGYAVDADEFGSLAVSDGHFSATEGVYAEYGTSLMVDASNLTKTAEGVEAYDVAGVWIQGNNISFGTGDEVDVEEASEVVVSGNTLYQTADTGEEQVYLYEVGDATVTWNNGSAGDYGVDLEDSSGAWVAHNRLTGTTDTAFYGEYDTNVTVWDNDFHSPGDYGLYAYYLTNFVFSDNLADRSGDYGAYIEYGTNGMVSDNNLSYFGYTGVYVEDSGNITVRSNQLSYGTSGDGAGIYTDDSAQLWLLGNNASWDYYGWEDYDSTGLTVVGDDFANSGGTGEDSHLAGDSPTVVSDGYGIYLEDDGGITVSDTVGSDSYYGIYGEDVDGLWVSDSQFAGAGYAGVELEDATDATFTDVGLNGSLEYGVYSEDSAYLDLTNVWATSSVEDAFYLDYDQAVSVVDCNAAKSGYSVDAYEVTGLLLAASNLSESGYGLYLYETAGAVVDANTFWADNDSFDYESGNTGVLYHNNFIGDKGWVIDATPTAAFQWDNGYPSGGNYYSNYTGVDQKSGAGQNLPGSDGIGDTPYDLNVNNTDQYPLMGPWVAHTLTFTETGLVPGTTWWVSVNGQSAGSSSSTLVVLENDGATSTYNYSVLPVPGYHASPTSGSGTESRTNLEVSIAFTPVNYTVTFSAPGIPSSGTWSITVGGHTLTATGPTLAVPEGNGTYTYGVGKGSDYTFAPGSFRVAGAPVTVTLSVTEVLYNVTFTETGLGSGTSWSVTLNGVTKTSTGPTIVFQEPNGTYSYTVGSAGGLSGTPSSSQTTVSGGAVSVGVAYATAGGFTPLDWGLLAGLIVALILALIGWMMYLRRRKPSPGPMTPAYVPPPPGQGPR